MCSPFFPSQTLYSLLFPLRHYDPLSSLSDSVLLLSPLRHCDPLLFPLRHCFPFLPSQTLSYPLFPSQTLYSLLFPLRHCDPLHFPLRRCSPFLPSQTLYSFSSTLDIVFHSLPPQMLYSHYVTSLLLYVDETKCHSH